MLNRSGRQHYYAGDTSTPAVDHDAWFTAGIWSQHVDDQASVDDDRDRRRHSGHYGVVTDSSQRVAGRFVCLR